MSLCLKWLFLLRRLGAFKGNRGGAERGEPGGGEGRSVAVRAKSKRSRVKRRTMAAVCFAVSASFLPLEGSQVEPK